jgi:hypothetical protein
MGKRFAVLVVLLLTLMLSHQAKGARTGEVGGTNRAHHVVMHMNSSDARGQYKTLNNTAISIRKWAGSGFNSSGPI